VCSSEPGGLPARRPDRMKASECKQQTNEMSSVYKTRHVRTMGRPPASTSRSDPQLHTIVHPVSHSTHHEPTSQQPTMRSAVYVACFLAAAALATPIQHEARMIQANQASGHNANSQSNASYGPGGMSQSASSSESTYSSSNVVQSISPIMSTINQLQGMMGGGSFSISMASQLMSQIATQMQAMLTSVNSCSCFASPQVTPMLGQMFGQLYSVMNSMQSTFGQSAMSNILSSFGSLAPMIQQFTQQYSSLSAFSSISQQGFAPMINLLGTVNPAFSNILPGMAGAGGISGMPAMSGAAGMSGMPPTSGAPGMPGMPPMSGAAMSGMPGMP
ncbi:hypothetical protein PTTG_10271, partial [Puccinia triticina 1-1 BBBD Race 1]